MNAIKKFNEHLIVASILAVYILFFHTLLITHTRMFSHDTIWFYGIFHYFSGSLLNGIFPYWDPFDYSGQPFYLNLSIMHLINPITIILIFCNKVLQVSLVTLYHWNFMIYIIISGLGVYFLSRNVNKYKFTSYVVLFIFLFSSFTYIALRQAGFLYSFIWLPWVLLFMLRLIKGVSFYNIVGLGLFLGLAMSGYQGLYVLVYMIVFTLSLLVNKRVFIKSIFEKRNRLFIIPLILIIISISMPLISVFKDKDDFLPMARMRTSPHITDSYTNRTGSVPARIGDFFGLISRDRAVKGYFEKKVSLSEGFLHIGILPLLLAVVGLILSRDEFKINFLITLLFLFFIMLGDSGKVQGVVNFIFPPFKFVRHMQLFAGFFIFNLIWFSGKGLEYLIAILEADKRKRFIPVLIMGFILVEMLSYGKQAFPLVTLPRERMRFSEYPGRLEFTNRRDTRIVSHDDIRYFKPILYGRCTAFNAASIPKHFSSGALKHDLFTIYLSSQGEDVFAFSREMSDKNVKDFVEYGIANFASWQEDDKLAFLDILHLITMDMLIHKDFYSYFDRAVGLAVASRGFIEKGYEEVLSGRDDWTMRSGAMEYLNLIFNLQLLKKKGAGDKRFKFIDSTYDFQKRYAAHLMLYKNISVRDYIEYLWNSGHVEEFTLLISKSYMDFMSLRSRYKDEAEKKRITENTEKIAGISDDIIRFYPNAVFTGRDNIIKAIKESRLDDSVIYLDGPSEKNTKLPGNVDGMFMYDILSYSPNTLMLKYSSSNPGFLYYSDGYDRYWKAFLDGKQIDIDKAFLSFKAVEIPAGEHDVVFLYDPAFFKLSLYLYYFTILLCVIFLCLPRQTASGLTRQVVSR